jgi:AcrR family transcriptional regulator
METGNKAKSPARGPRGSYAKSDLTRAAILDAALEVFAKDGYRSGSIRDVALRVGISEAGLLHHFSSKPKLLAAVLDRRDELAEHIIPRDLTDGVSALRALIELARFNASEPGVVELYCTLSAEATSPRHPAHDYFVDRYIEIRHRLQTAFEDLDRQGLVRSGISPEVAVRATIAIMDGLQVQWLLDRSLLDMGEELREFFRTLTTAEI